MNNPTPPKPEPLKPCKICGKTPEPIATVGGWAMLCDLKRCSEQQGYFTKEEAIKAWNTRQPSEGEIE